MTTWIAQTAPFADAWGMHNSDVGFGWWLVMTLGMLLFLGVVIAVLVSLLRGGTATRPDVPPPAGGPSAREILDRRLADGSIDAEEYERRRRLLDGGRSEPRGPEPAAS